MADQFVYLDHAATTPVDPRVVEAMRPYFVEAWGNPSSVYALGRRARRALDDARDRSAQVLRCRANEVVFTGCGTESDNLAIKGAAIAQAELRGWRHVVTTRIEHHAVLLEFDVPSFRTDRSRPTPPPPTPPRTNRRGRSPGPLVPKRRR